ncbi:hypothetical protein [Chromohalobacter sp. 48-RD10]|uniref:hypothetical protein n=1 Tax=Chromohalobacter sp. 48-RD10 TaxID=2994063 RepID=UPI0024683CEA|nr:hypothetical protein [Chromohalobacter sp. 48-RD10]
MFSIYRFFDSAFHAADFLEGRIRVSTLEACRGYEDPRRGDKGEGTWTYKSGDIKGAADNPAVRYVAERIGVKVEGVGGAKTELSISNNTAHTKMTDAFVLCFTMNNTAGFASGTFGEHGVRVIHPQTLFQRITKEIQKSHSLSYSGMGRVEYKERLQVSLQSDPRHIAFIKTPDQYADQVEFRMLWVPQANKKISPFFVSCGRIQTFAEKA